MDTLTREPDKLSAKGQSGDANYWRKQSEYIRVRLIKPIKGGLGFNMMGGWDMPMKREDNDPGFFITKIREGGVAAMNGQLQVGDKIIEVNGKVLHTLSHPTAVNIFRSSGREVNMVIERAHTLPVEKAGTEADTITSDKPFTRSLGAGQTFTRDMLPPSPEEQLKPESYPGPGSPERNKLLRGCLTVGGLVAALYIIYRYKSSVYQGLQRMVGRIASPSNSTSLAEGVQSGARSLTRIAEVSSTPSSPV